MFVPFLLVYLTSGLAPMVAAIVIDGVLQMLLRDSDPGRLFIVLMSVSLSMLLAATVVSFVYLKRL